MHLGPSGSGSMVKLLSNHIAGLVNLVVAEAFTLGAAAGFGFETLLEVFAHTDANTYLMSDYIAPRLHRRDLAAGFSVDLMYKDHRLAGELVPQSRRPDVFQQPSLGELPGAEGPGTRPQRPYRDLSVLAEAVGITIDELNPASKR